MIVLQPGRTTNLLLWQYVAKLAQYGFVILAIAFALGTLLQYGAPLEVASAWLGYFAVAVIASYACRRFATYLGRMRRKA